MDVFVSYARVDRTVVDEAVAALDRNGTPYWFDRRDIPVSFPWRTEIRHAIRTAAVVVVLESDGWHASRYCNAELDIAAELHKPVIYIAVHDTHPDEVVAIVEHALSALTRTQQAHADLLARSGSWDRNGRDRSGLVGGRLLERLRLVERTDWLLPPEAAEFLTASEARDLRRRRLRRAGTFVVLVALGVGWFMQKVGERGEEQLREQAAALTAAARAHYQTLEDPYAGLRMAADEVRKGNHGSLATSALVEALNIPVPDESTVVPGNSLVGFVDSSSTVPAVRDATGAVLDLSGAPAAVQPGATSSPTVGDRWGDVTVRAANADIAAVGTASGAVVVRSGAHRSTTIEPDVDHGAVTALDVDAATSAVAVAHDRSGVVSVYDPATGQLRRRVPVGAPVRGVAISPDGRTLAVGSKEKVVLADISTGRHRVDLRARDEPVRAVSWSADGTSIWAIAGEHRVSRWHWRDGRRLADDRSAWFVSLSAPGPDGSLIAVTRDGDVHRVRDTGTGAGILARTGLTVLSASVDPTAEQVLLGTVTGELHLLELRTRTARIIDDRPGCTPLSTAWIPQKPLAVVACWAGPLRWVSTNGSAPSRDVSVPSGGSGAVTAGADGTVYLGAANGLVYRTSAENPELNVISSDLNPTEWRTVTLSPDGQTLLLTGTGTGNLGHLYVGHADGDDWSWYTISLLKDEAEQSRAAAISPDGQIAAIGVASGTIHFLATRSGNLGLTRTDVSGSVTGLRFTESGLVAASRDGVIERIDPCTGCELPARLLDTADRRLADGVRFGLTG